MSVLEDVAAGLDPSIIGSVPRRGYPPGGSVKILSHPHGDRAAGALCNLCESVREVFGANRESWRIL
jgi:hypothetical protein